MLPTAPILHRRRFLFILQVSLRFLSYTQTGPDVSCDFSNAPSASSPRRKSRISASPFNPVTDLSHAKRCLAINEASPGEVLPKLSNDSESCKHNVSRFDSVMLPPEPQLDTRPLHKVSVKNVYELRKNPVTFALQNVHKQEAIVNGNDPKHVQRKGEAKNTVCVESVVIGGKSRKKSKVEALIELQQKVDLLRSEQALVSDIDALLKRRAFKSVTPEQLANVLNVLRDFCPSGKKACEVLVKNAGVIWQPVELLRQKLEVLAEFGVGEEACLCLATSVHMLTVKAEKLQETLQFLKDIGLSVESINKIIRKKPQTLRLSVRNSMQPTVNFLLSIGMSDVRILKLLERRPELFAMSIDNNLMVKYEFFRRLGLSVEKFSSALRSMTQFSNDTILARLDTIKEHGFSDADVQEMIQRQPNILANSSEAITNKLDYLLNQQKRAIKEVVKFPACLGCSLEKRIKPRFKFLEENGLPKLYSLSTILARKETDFNRVMQTVWFCK